MRSTALIRVPLLLAVFALAISPASHLFAKDVVFMEDFTSTSANWLNFNRSAFLTYNSVGGPDGGSFASGPRNFNNLVPGNTTIILRAQHDFDASNDNFKRDWLADDITDVNLWVRHNFSAPLTYIMRVASEDNAHGHVYQADGLAVAPNQWTQINFDVSRFSPTLLSDEGNTYSQVYSNLGFVTFGVFVPTGLPTKPDGSIDNNFSYTFGVDKVTILSPEPTSALISLLGFAGFAFTRGRRPRSNATA